MATPLQRPAGSGTDGCTGVLKISECVARLDSSMTSVNGESRSKIRQMAETIDIAASAIVTRAKDIARRVEAKAGKYDRDPEHQTRRDRN